MSNFISALFEATLGGNSSTPTYVNFDYVLGHPSAIYIHVMDAHEEGCLLPNTIAAAKEEEVINAKINADHARGLEVIVYGRNACDVERAREKAAKLISYGFDAKIYAGGVFEWLLLREIHGAEEFQVEGNGDFLKFA